MKNNIEKYNFKEGLELEFEIVDIEKLFQEHKEIMTEPHRAQFYQILWIEKGSGIHNVDFNLVEIEDHTVLFLPFNCISGFAADCQYKGKMILFTSSFYCKNERDVHFLTNSMLFSDLYQNRKIKLNPQISELEVVFNSMQTEYSRQTDCAKLHILHNMLHIFIMQSEREMRKQGFNKLEPSVTYDDLTAFREILEQKYKTEKTVSQYAYNLNLSEKRLHKATTSLVDKTPKQLIDERVILEAKRLLVHSNQSVKEIAYELGFEEPTNFNKYFKKHSGTTPAEFRVQY